MKKIIDKNMATQPLVELTNFDSPLKEAIIGYLAKV